MPPPLVIAHLLMTSLSTTVAFWLRSSVVSVLFSLISESSLRRTININLIFITRVRSSVLAHDRRPPCPWYYTASRRREPFFFIAVLELVSGSEEIDLE
ncbi:hypothetical protein Micbo1qcDRAFT_163681 [Microdochium bolleyi]|uniref:Uncharacterized protein n=1 Tax=Microdochium bolleyi TaxID=196109 RepID=A0A136J185_9PEZI|nr:hypothetical protein Micbo1qcDRAFT_163681 [Microdochium bolleyi]